MTSTEELAPPTYEPAVWSGYYDKLFHWVHLPDGSRVECWPNAGWMNATDGSGRHWSPEDKPVVSLQRDEESRFYRPDKIRELASRVNKHQRLGIVAAGRGLEVQEVLVIRTRAEKHKLEHQRAKRARQNKKRKKHGL